MLKIHFSNSFNLISPKYLSFSMRTFMGNTIDTDAKKINRPSTAPSLLVHSLQAWGFSFFLKMCGLLDPKGGGVQGEPIWPMY